MSNKLYAERDIQCLDEDGNFYFKHVMAMTSEGLHSKSAIAAELGYRDSKIVELQSRLERANEERDALAATVEALRKIFPLKALIGCDARLNYPVSQYNDMVEAFNASPHQHLCDVQAEAGRAGFIAGLEYPDKVHFEGATRNPVFAADEYAEKVRSGSQP